MIRSYIKFVLSVALTNQRVCQDFVSFWFLNKRCTCRCSLSTAGLMDRNVAHGIAGGRNLGTLACRKPASRIQLRDHSLAKPGHVQDHDF